MEVGAHTKTHSNLTTLSDAAALTEITGSRQSLVSLGISPVDTFAYPFGAYNSAHESQVASAGFTSSRTVDVGFNTKTTDKFALKSQSIMTSTTFAEAKSWIDAAIANKLWLIMTVHGIDSVPNLNARGDPYGTTPQILQQIVTYLQGQQSAGAVSVKSMHDGVIAN